MRYAKPCFEVNRGGAGGVVTSKPITDRGSVVRTVLGWWVCRAPCNDGDVGNIGDGDVGPRKNAAVPVEGVGCEDVVVGHFGRGIRPSGVGQTSVCFSTAAATVTYILYSRTIAGRIA